MRTTLSTIVFVVIAVLALAACQPATTPTPDAPEADVSSPEETTPDGAGLAGTSWVLSSLDGSLPLPGTTVTLQFGDGEASGSDGCNRFSTTYTQDGTDLTINQPMAGTMMACPPPVMEQAAAFTTALAGVTSFTATERQLILFAGDEIVATFVTDSQSLAGTEWDVISYNNGREAVVSLLLDTEISASFETESDLAGNAGCNQYVTSYAVAANTIEIGVPATTFRFCAEPDGVMEQELEYLNALQSAATFSIQGDLLEMRTAGDQIAVVMLRKVVVDLPAPEPAPEAGPATATGRVVGTNALNVRSGPGTGFPVIGVARSGDEGEIVGRSEDGRWWAVSAPSTPGGIGWVSVDFVLATNVEDVPVIAAPTLPTPTPIPAPVATPTRAPTTPPTPPPPATATPVPAISFWADRTNINQGECATLNWSVQNVQAVWVYPRGQQYSNFPRAGMGSETVCPSVTTTWEMRVLLRDGSTQFREVTINVAAPPPTATPAPAPDPLAGTRWEVVNYNNGRGAVVSLILDTRISLNFGTDGQITGSAGCNDYFTSYRVSGSGITVGPPGSTTRACGEPEGVMEQEIEFLNALQSATTFRINGAMLEMRTASDAMAIVAQRVP